jgi:hypothetical protein
MRFPIRPLVRAGALACIAGTALLAATPLSSLHAQRTDEDWLEDCRDHDWGDDEREVVCEVRTLEPRLAGRLLTVDGMRNGGVHVEASDQPGVHVSARIQTRARRLEDAAALARELRIVADGDRLRAEGPAQGDRASWAVSYVIRVPRSHDLDITTHNGPISVRGVSGQLRLEAQNGPISLRGVSGDVHARTRNGPLSVELAGAKWDGRGLDAETRNGPVTLDIPDGYSARLETGTVNGPMRIDFPVTVQGRIGRRIETTLGEGGPTIRAVTTNGPVTIRRG